MKGFPLDQLDEVTHFMALWSQDATLVKEKHGDGTICFQGILLLGRLQIDCKMKLHEAACPELHEICM